jgi:hypothetical protein
VVAVAGGGGGGSSSSSSSSRWSQFSFLMECKHVHEPDFKNEAQMDDRNTV